VCRRRGPPITSPCFGGKASILHGTKSTSGTRYLSKDLEASAGKTAAKRCFGRTGSPNCYSSVGHGELMTGMNDRLSMAMSGARTQSSLDRPQWA